MAFPTLDRRVLDVILPPGYIDAFADANLVFYLNPAVLKSPTRLYYGPRRLGPVASDGFEFGSFSQPLQPIHRGEFFGLHLGSSACSGVWNPSQSAVPGKNTEKPTSIDKVLEVDSIDTLASAFRDVNLDEKVDPQVEPRFAKYAHPSEETGVNSGEAVLDISSVESGPARDLKTLGLVVPSILPPQPDILHNVETKRRRERRVSLPNSECESLSPSLSGSDSRNDSCSESGNSYNLVDQIEISVLVDSWRSQMMERLMNDLNGLVRLLSLISSPEGTSCMTERDETCRNLTFTHGSTSPSSKLDGGEDDPQRPSGQLYLPIDTLCTNSLELPPSAQKRKRSTFSDDNIGNLVDSGSGSQPKESKRQNTTQSQQKLACPYYQRDSSRHPKYPSCAGPGWQSIHRLKEHLYRRHAQPIHCPRCYLTFQNDEGLTSHSRAATQCPVGSAAEFEGFDKSQAVKLRRRTKRPQVTEVEKWKEVYQILFPNDDIISIPSAFCLTTPSRSLDDQDQVGSYDEFLKKNLPSLVQSELERYLQQQSTTLEEQMKGKLLDIIRDCQTRLSHDYAQIGSSERRNDSEVVDVPQLLQDLDAYKSVDPLPNDFAFMEPGTNGDCHFLGDATLGLLGGQREANQPSGSGYGELPQFLGLDNEWDILLKDS